MLYDNQKKLELTLQQKFEFDKTNSSFKDTEMIKNIVNESKYELLREVNELREAMSKLLVEKQKLVEDLSNSESNISNKFVNKIRVIEDQIKNREFDYSVEKQELNEKIINGSKEISIIQFERNKFLEELSNKERLISDLEKQLSCNLDQTNLYNKSEEM